jgi:hypothetical protein
VAASRHNCLNAPALAEARSFGPSRQTHSPAGASVPVGRLPRTGPVSSGAGRGETGRAAGRWSRASSDAGKPQRSESGGGLLTGVVGGVARSLAPWLLVATNRLARRCRAGGANRRKVFGPTEYGSRSDVSRLVSRAHPAQRQRKSGDMRREAVRRAPFEIPKRASAPGAGCATRLPPRKTRARPNICLPSVRHRRLCLTHAGELRWASLGDHAPRNTRGYTRNFEANRPLVADRMAQS